ncbi:hypothetical protein [Streptomyces sp. NPDC048442]|uniref:hypothetical protein n=1 Tax=Streptomyces sp. NPDC048442 TaxID=3154823 RepID=UPI00341AB8B4
MLLLALVLLFLFPLFGAEGPSASAAAKPPRTHSAAAVVSLPQADSLDERRGCHEGQPGVPRGAVAPRPEQPGAHIPRATSVLPGPQHDAPAVPGPSPPDTTSVDLHRIQISRT